MPAYLVRLPDTPARVLFNGANAVAVFAADEATAKTMAKAQFDGDANALWDQAVVTEIAAGADMEGWTFRVTVTSPLGVIVGDVEVVGGAAGTIDTIGTAMAAALNALADIAGASYTGATQILVVASGAGGDDLGDHTVTAAFYPPNVSDPKASVAGFVVSITDGGAAADALSVTLAADAYVIPKIAAAVQY